jgi:hypothetical protein
VIELAALVVLAASVVWGATSTPGRPFSWTMFSGSSKGFLWMRGDGGSHWADIDELHLAPDAHYLREADLRRLAEDGLPALDGLIVGSSGSWTVAHDGGGHALRAEPIAREEDLARLAATLRRHACRER